MWRVQLFRLQQCPRKAVTAADHAAPAAAGWCGTAGPPLWRDDAVHRPREVRAMVAEARARLAERPDSLDRPAYLQPAGVDLDAQGRLRERLLV